MKTLLLLLLLLPLLCGAENDTTPKVNSAGQYNGAGFALGSQFDRDPIKVAGGERNRLLSLRWKVSAVALAGGVGADIASSWGHQEANPLARSSDGTLRWKGVGMSVGIVAVTLISQYAAMRKLPRDNWLRKFFEGTNYSVGAWRGGVAVRNWRTP